MENEQGVTRKVDDFLEIFKKGEEFTKELLKENEKLRFRIAQLEEGGKNSLGEEKIRFYEERINTLKEEIDSLTERYQRVEEENKDFASKYV